MLVRSPVEVTVSDVDPLVPRAEKTPRANAGRSVARIAKVAAASAAVAGLGVFALLARATHPGGVRRTSTQPPLSAPKSFVRALDTGFSPGSVGPAAGPAQTVSGGS
jgi:hypothetical protein